MASRAPALLVPLLAIFFYGIGSSWCACNVTVLTSQLNSLLSLYDREAPPDARVKVSTKLDVRHASIDEITSSLHLLADFRMYWNDSRLTWNATDNGCAWALSDADKLWQPDIELVNAAADSAPEQQLSVHVSSAGAVTYSARLDVITPIALQLDDWPNDKQNGVYKFASRSHGSDEIILTGMQIRAAVFESGTWELLGVTGFTSSLEAEAEGEVARSLHQYVVRLRRRAPSQALAARVVLCCALLLLGAAALLPPASRAPLAAAAAFIVALWLMAAAWRLPGGAQAPRALRVQGAVCGAAGAAAAAAVLVARLARRAAPPPQLVRNLVITASKVIPFSALPEAESGARGTWAAAAHALDSALLAALGLVLFILLCIYL